MHGIHFLHRAALLCGAVLGASSAAGAQTLPQTLAAVYESHPALLAARFQLQAADEGVSQALSGWRPTVTITGGYGFNDTRNRGRAALPDGSNTSFYQDQYIAPANGALVLSQPIYQGGRTISSTRRAESQVLAQRARVLATEQRVLYDAAVAYVELLRDVELLRLNEEYLGVLQQQRAGTRRRFDAGELTRTDALQAESRLATAQGSLEAARGALENSRATFIRAVGAEPGRLTAPQPLRPAAPDLAALRATAARENPNVVSAQFDEQAARDAIDVQFSQLMPQLNLQAQTFRNDNGNSRGGRNTGEAVTATLSVPLYQGGAEYAAVRQSRETAQQARQLLEDQRRLAMQQGTQAWETSRSARAQAETSRRAISALEGAVDGVQREALLGSRTTIEVLNAEAELLNARVGLLQTVSSIVTASYAMAVAVGRMTAHDLRLPVRAYDWDEHYRAARGRLVGLGG
jgi:outer membrane protein